MNDEIPLDQENKNVRSVSATEPEPIFEQDKYGLWHCRFGDEEYPHFADLIGFAYYAYILKRPFTTIGAGDIEGRPLRESTRSVQVVGQTGKRRRGVGDINQSPVSDEEYADFEPNGNQPRWRRNEDDSNKVIDAAGRGAVEKAIDLLIAKIDREQQQEDPNEELIDGWQRQLAKMQEFQAMLVNKHGRTRTITAGDPFTQQIKRVERNLGTCRRVIKDEMPKLR